MVAHMFLRRDALTLLVVMTVVNARGTKCKAHPVGGSDKSGTQGEGDEPAAIAPLFLSPYIKAGDLERGRKLSRVGRLPRALASVPVRESYSGFITVDPERGSHSHLFFWFFPAVVAPESAPIILWLDGGPGFSFLFSVFNQNGPYTYVHSRPIFGGVLVVDESIDVRPSELDWTLNYSMIYVDSPVGTGFSYTTRPHEVGGATSGPPDPITSEGNAVHLLSFLRQFRTLFPEYATARTQLHIVGESYGGHVGPALGAHILNTAPNIAPHFAGMLLLAPWINPALQVSFYGDYMYQLGLIDNDTFQTFRDEQVRIQELIAAGRYTDAKHAWYDLVARPGSGAYANASGFAFAFHALQAGVDPMVLGALGTEFQSYLSSPEFRRALHAGADTNYSVVSAHVMDAMVDEIMRPSQKYVTEILDFHRGAIWNANSTPIAVTLVSAQLDTTIVHLGVEATANALEWSGAQEWIKAKRSIWKTADGAIGGYIRSARNLNYAMIRNAGHFVISDQPQWTMQLVNKFIPSQSGSRADADDDDDDEEARDAVGGSGAMKLPGSHGDNSGHKPSRIGKSGGGESESPSRDKGKHVFAVQMSVPAGSISPNNNINLRLFAPPL